MVEGLTVVVLMVDRQGGAVLAETRTQGGRVSIEDGGEWERRRGGWEPVRRQEDGRAVV